MQLHPFPEPDAPELEHYMLYSRAEIVALLNRIGQERILVTVYTGNDGSFAVSMVLQVDAEREIATFDMPVNPEAQQRVLGSRDLVFVVFFENVKIQFRAPSAQAVTFDQRAAFHVGLPDQMLRLQRREFFRVRTPVTGQAKCLVPLADGASKYESLPLINISVGGLAVMSYPDSFDLPMGQLVRNCILDLPGIGPVGVAFRVVNIYDEDADSAGRTFGCQFVDLAPQARLMLQRYVNRVEAEQRKAQSR
jgi:c-di-GMP-binding flagellar brake protein YcgR